MPKSKNIVIFSAKGGVGKTFLATNLAVILAHEEKHKTLLVDLDLRVVSDMAKMLDLHPERSMADLMHLLNEERHYIPKEEFITRTKYGVDFLPAIIKPQETPHVKEEKLRGALDLYSEDYEYIIIDAGQAFSGNIVEAFNHAHLIILMVTSDILSIYQARFVLETLQSLRFPLKMVKIVLNRAEAISSLSWQEVTVALPCNVIGQIPSEGKTVVAAVNLGVPVVVESPRAKATQAIRKLAQTIESQNDLFLEHREGIDYGRLKELVFQKSGDFWIKKGLTATLQELDIGEDLDDLTRIKTKVHKRLIDELNLKKIDYKVFRDPKLSEDLRNRAEKLIVNFLAEEGKGFIASSELREELVNEIINEALGLGPLEDLLDNPDITDIMVNNKDEIYVERSGKIELTSKRFTSNEQVRTIIERIIAPIGRHIDESVPMVDARLADGSRVNAVIPPLSLTGPTLTIRKFRKERISIEELVNYNSLNKLMADFIMASVLTRKNIIVSGGTGSGKTTILNVLSAFIPHNERIVTIEDAAELKLSQEHWVRMETRPPNIEGKGGITIRDLFRNCLRMRPDRIIIGECRGQETLDMLQAMNTGHDGSMTTLHANSPQDVLSRLDSLILMSGVELPIRAIREMVSSAVHVLVHTARLSDGTRKIVRITELAGMDTEGHILLKDIFVFKQTSVTSDGKVIGDFQATGNIPSFMNEIKIKGLALSEDIFKK